MGDVIHLLPALTDLKAALSESEVDWMVDQSFAEIPAWHTGVEKVIPVATRRWRKLRWSVAVEFFKFIKHLRKQRYDVVIDAQGLIKSAVLARLARLSKNGYRAGFSTASLKERPAARFYHKKIAVARDAHAIPRLRLLLSQTLDYEFDADKLMYGIGTWSKDNLKKQILFFHGTTWQSKHLPKSHWRALIKLAAQDGFEVLLAWGNENEHQRAVQLAAGHLNATVLPSSSLTQLKSLMAEASGAIAVDTGLGHLAAALGVPTVSIYGATNAALTGAIGSNQVHLQTTYHCSPCLLKQCDKLETAINSPPCYAELSPKIIWAQLRSEITV